MEAEEEGPGMEDEEDADNAEVERRDLAGGDIRARLAAQLSAPQDLPPCLSEHD